MLHFLPSKKLPTYNASCFWSIATSTVLALSGRVPGARLLCRGRALPRLALLLGFLPRKEQAARGWETPLAPSCLQLCSCLAFALRFQASLRRAQGLVGCTLPRAPAVRALSEGSEGNSRYPSAVAWLPRLSAARRAPGSKGPWLGFAAPHT